MIVCDKRHLLARCIERGYTVEAVMPCVVAQDGDQWTIDETHTAYPHQRRGLGDMVTAGLTAIGITEKRVSAAIGRPCGCKERAAKLNALGRKVGIG